MKHRNRAIIAIIVFAVFYITLLAFAYWLNQILFT